ncbi:hypothetical protein MUN82_17445 [Hymenobacter aerilatus]|uniref:Uncharacterized protein n=1 Tax=Hymenobacter aerilatus TaxID=2932251 RepID=A0A8T9STR2_9BACT|nr:hypothetical protein [Hymenobacter aerilatus]UOR04721.1 hypothetical protein MUN82_17445 [Hymenobacter aerilatus]
MAEDYAAKMGRKTDAELRQYVDHYSDYQEEAVLAALDELERRGQEVAAAGAIRTDVQPVVAQRAAEAATIRAAEVAAVAEPEQVAGPELYSPATIAIFSVMFSFLAGGILLAINLFKLDKQSKALRLLLFVVLYLLGSSYLLQWAVLQFGESAKWISAAVNLGAVVAYLWFFWPRYVGQRSYLSRGWLPALVVCLLVFGALYWLMLPLMGQMSGATLP